MGVSVEVLTEAIIAVAEVVRGNQKNQDYLASMSLVNPHDPQPRYAHAHFCIVVAKILLLFPIYLGTSKYWVYINRYKNL